MTHEPRDPAYESRVRASFDGSDKPIALMQATMIAVEKKDGLED